MFKVHPMATTSHDSRYEERVVPFTAGDGFPLNLVHVRGRQTPSRGPVLLVHGAGVRANLFRAPTDTNLVDALIAAGYDVWLENWRASIDFPPNLWTLDQAAVYDHPRAVDKVLEETGAETVKDLGKVMPVVIAQVAGGADGKRISAMVRSLLS